MSRIRSPITWPNGARIAVNLSVALETWPGDLGMPESLQAHGGRQRPREAVFKKDLAFIMDRQYGERVGTSRILDLLERASVRSTFFLNGITVERFPELAKDIKRMGHELASETYIHDYSYMKSEEKDREDIRRSVIAFEKVLGERPLGYVSTGYGFTDSTPKILAEEGYSYWVDPCHEELPYTLGVAGRQLTVLSYNYGISDYSTISSSGWTPRQMFEMWKDSFDLLYNEGAENPTRMVVSIHPFLTGRPHRAKVLEEFLHYAKSFRGVWFAPFIDVVNWWLKNYRDSHVEEWPNYESK